MRWALLAIPVVIGAVIDLVWLWTKRRKRARMREAVNKLIADPKWRT